jgi:hypothetical protein
MNALMWVVRAVLIAKGVLFMLAVLGFGIAYLVMGNGAGKAIGVVLVSGVLLWATRAVRGV